MVWKYPGCKFRALQDWSCLNDDVLSSIFDLLPIVDMLRVRCVCSPWRSLAKSHVKSRLIRLHSSALPPPMLVLPRLDMEDYLNHPESLAFREYSSQPPERARYLKEAADSHRLYRLDDRSFTRLKLPLLEGNGGHCVGASHGWLMLIEGGNLNLFLYNPLLEIKIHLPSPPSCSNGGDKGKHWIQKAILFGSDSDPLSITGNKCGVMIIYGYFSSLAFLMCGDSKWRTRGFEDEWYQDLATYKDCVFALTNQGFLQVWEWDFCSFTPTLTNKINIAQSLPGIVSSGDLIDDDGFWRFLAFNKTYIAPTNFRDEVLLVGRSISESIPLYEKYADRVRPSYSTNMFEVYKLNIDKQELVPFETLDDQVIFVGANQSVSFSAKDLSCCEKNSVYFTDDWWEKADKSPLSGGHDVGIFNLKSGYCRRVHESFCWKQSPAFWLLPKP